MEGVIGSARGAQLQKAGVKDMSFIQSPPEGSEVKKMKDHCEAPPAPLCLHRESFQLPPNTIFACWDIREVWREKMIAYTHALQYWVEKSDPPTGGQPHQLAESVKELDR